MGSRATIEYYKAFESGLAQIYVHGGYIIVTRTAMRIVKLVDEEVKAMKCYDT
jgi:hypothetical protein